jgi:hypothetical protein
MATTRWKRTWLALALASGGLLACGAETGSVSLALMAGGNTLPPPSSGHQFIPGLPENLPGTGNPTVTSVIITLAKVEVHLVPSYGDHDDIQGEESPDRDANARADDHDGDWMPIPLAVKQLNLLALEKDPGATLGELQLPPGKITQIRLFLDPAGQNYAMLSNGTVCSLDLSGLLLTGITINHPFRAIDVPMGEKVVVVVDIDLQMTQKPAVCEFTINPVINIRRVEVNPQ